MKYKISSAAFLFLGTLVVTLFLQVSPSRSSANLNGADQALPNAELEIEAVDQVQEINEHNFKNFDIPTSTEE